MQRKYSYIASIAALCGAVQLLRCGPLAGGVDLPDFKVTGVIVMPDGLGAPATSVQMIPVTYDPVKDPPLPDSLADTTDANGRFRFSDVPRGDYNIQAIHQTQRTRLLRTGIRVETDAIVVPADTLKAPGAVKITLFSPDTPDTANGYFYFAGTTISISLKENSGFVVLDSVPAGRTPALYYAIKDNPSASHKIRDSVTVTSAATTSITYSDWSYSRRCILNTTASGAGVPGTVTGFPVLVRLTKSNFNFTEAKSGGEDLRFSRSGNRPLAFEIERWDAVAGLAEVWVKVDTVFGDNGTQYITMHWGNPSAAAASSGTAVFDTSAAGGAFQGVWHLAQPGNTTVYDATANGYDGTPYNMSVASAVPGIIGTAQQFSRDSAHIEMSNTASGKLNFPENGRYTVSAWVHADTIDCLHHVIATKGHMQYYLKLKINTWEFVEWKNNLGCQVTEDSGNAVARQWRHLAGVRDGASQRLFVNGRCIDSTPDTKSFLYPTDQSQNFSIGSYLQFITLGDNQGFAGFKGKLDEIRVSSLAQSSDWVKLSYMNQKTDDALVKFE